jgi:ribosomal protein L34E
MWESADVIIPSRGLLNFATALSLVLCAGCLVLISLSKDAMFVDRGFEHFEYTPGDQTLHWWLFALVFALLPAGRALRHWKRVTARKVGHCAVCGYDLRATPERCPECGAAVAGFHTGRADRLGEYRL